MRAALPRRLPLLYPAACDPRATHSCDPAAPAARPLLRRQILPRPH